MRWLCDLVGYGPASFGLLTSGGVMANFMGMALARDIHLGRLLGRRPGAARGDARGRPRLHLRPDPLLDRSGARPARLPARDARRHPVGRSVPAARRAGRGGRRRAIARPGSTPFAIAASPDRPTPARSTPSASWPTSPRPRTCGSTSTPRTAARRGCRRATPTACADLDRANSVTVDPHKWFFQAYDIGGLLVRDGRAPRRRSSAAGRPSTTAAARRRRRRDADDARRRDHGDQLNFYKLSFEGTRRWRALKLWMSWKHLGTDGFARLIEANDDLAALPRPPLRRVRRLRGHPGRPGTLGRLLPAPARWAGRGARARARRRSTPTRTDSRRPSRRPATAG